MTGTTAGPAGGRAAGPVGGPVAGLDFGLDKEQERYRQHVRMLLADEPVRQAVAAAHADPDAEPDVRPLYRELGRRGLLAPHWPVEYGGGGRELVDLAIVYEELVRAGVPDQLHVNTVQIVGQFVLMAGTPAQRAAYLPAMAAGELFGSVFYTEPEVGSDLGSLATTATPDGAGGWRLDGVKVFGMKVHLTDVALCAVRTGPPDSRYEGISLVLLDQTAPGVRRTTVRSIADEQFHRIDLDGVRVTAADFLGPVNGGWPLLTECLVVERTGLDYLLKSETWLAAAGTLLGSDAGDSAVEDVGRFGAAVSASRLLTLQVLGGLADGRPDEAAAAAAKLYNSRLCQRIAEWAAVAVPPPAISSRPAAVLEAAYREAPGVTVAGGTSDMMLQIIASLALDRLEQEPSW